MPWGFSKEKPLSTPGVSVAVQEKMGHLKAQEAEGLGRGGVWAGASGHVLGLGLDSWPLGVRLAQEGWCPRPDFPAEGHRCVPLLLHVALALHLGRLCLSRHTRE